MSTEIKYKLRVNGTLEYEATAYTSASQIFSATIVSSDVTSVRESLSDIKLLEVLNKENLVLYSSASYNKLTSVNLRIGFGYDDKTGAFDLIQLGFEKGDLEKKVAELEAIVNPVINENAMTLGEFKAMKVAESKKLLQEYLAANPIKSKAHLNKEGIYSVTQDKQLLMMLKLSTYQSRLSTGSDAELTWNETGKSSEPWTEEEFVQLYQEIDEYVQPLVVYQQNLEEQINSLTSKSEIKALAIDYSSVVAE